MENFFLSGNQVLLALHIIAFDNALMVSDEDTARPARFLAPRVAGFSRRHVFAVQRETLGKAAGDTRTIYTERLRGIHQFLCDNQLHISSCSFGALSLLEHIPCGHGEFRDSLRDGFLNLLRAVASGRITEEMLHEAAVLKKEAAIAS